MPLVEKIRTIAQKVYGADDIELSAESRAKIDYYNQQVGVVAPPVTLTMGLREGSGLHTDRDTFLY